jgi:hypothetical protein
VLSQNLQSVICVVLDAQLAPDDLDEAAIWINEKRPPSGGTRSERPRDTKAFTDGALYVA